MKSLKAAQNSYRFRLMRTTVALVLIAVLFTGLFTSTLLTRYMNQQISRLQQQVIEQDMRTLERQFSIINQLIYNFSATSAVSLLQSGRGSTQARAVATIELSHQITNALTSVDGLQLLFYFLPGQNRIFSSASSDADTFVRYRITGDWDAAEEMLALIAGTQRLSYFPVSGGKLEPNSVLVVIPTPLNASQPRGFFCAVIAPELEKANHGVTDVRLLYSEHALLAAYGLPFRDSAPSLTDDTRITLDDTVYLKETRTLSLGGLHYVYLTSEALTWRHVRWALLVAGCVALVLSLLASVVALRFSSKLYRPVGMLINALIAEGHIAADRSEGELTAIGRLVDTVLMDNEKLARTVDRLSPMVDDLVFHHLLQNSHSPEVAEWMSAFDKKTLQLIEVRFAQINTVKAQHRGESFDRLNRLTAEMVRRTLCDAFCMRMAIVADCIYLVISHELTPEEFRLKIAPLLLQVQEQSISQYGLALLYVVSLPSARSNQLDENAELLREMDAQCIEAFERCWMLNQRSGGVWATPFPKVSLALMPMQLETKMLALSQVGRIKECWDLLQIQLQDYLLSEEVSCVSIRQLMLRGLEILHKGAAAGQSYGNFIEQRSRLEQSDTYEAANEVLREIFEEAAELCSKETNALPVKKEELDAFIERNWACDIDLRMAAEQWRLSEGYFSQVVKHLTGDTFPDYINRLRIEKARQWMMDISMSITEISERAGFNNYKTFTRWFRKYYDVSPSDYRRSLQNRPGKQIKEE